MQPTMTPHPRFATSPVGAPVRPGVSTWRGLLRLVQQVAHAVRHDLTAEAIRLTRLIRALMPEDGEVAGLLALMLLTEARRTARVSTSGELVTLEAREHADRVQARVVLIDRVRLAELIVFYNVGVQEEQRLN